MSAAQCGYWMIILWSSATDQTSVGHIIIVFDGAFYHKDWSQIYVYCCDIQYIYDTYNTHNCNVNMKVDVTHVTFTLEMEDNMLQCILECHDYHGIFIDIC